MDLDVQALKFDTLSYVKQLTSAGVEPQVAEIHAMTMANAFGMYIDNVVTTDYLDATLDKRFAEFDSRMERRFAEQDSKFEGRFNSTESDLRVLKWGQAVLVAAVLLPQVARLVS